MARKRLVDLAKHAGARWKIPGTGVVVIQDNHPQCPMVALESQPTCQWVLPYGFLIEMGAIPLDPLPKGGGT